MLPVVEIFTSIQGEGKFMGIPSIFVRVGGCNLRCIFKDSVCDTPYASFDTEKPLYKSLNQLVGAFQEEQNKYPKVNHVVITGGEPLLYHDALDQFLKAIWYDGMKITIETNGTQPILNPLNGVYRIELYSVSPKLSTSVGKQPGNVGGHKITQEMINKHDKERINIKNLINFVMGTKYQFKFVYSGPECVDEIMDIYSKMGNEIEEKDTQTINFYLRYHPMKNTYLMPEGVTSEQLNKRSDEIVDVCLKNGWKYSDRIQIRLWGDKRGV